MRGRRDGLDGEAEGKRFQLDAEHYLNQIVDDHYSGRWTVVSGRGHWLALETSGQTVNTRRLTVDGVMVARWALVTDSLVGSANDL